MSESWEDKAEETHGANVGDPAAPGAGDGAKAGGFKFDPNASAFSFNPKASAFAPGQTQASATAPAAPKPAAAAAPKAAAAAPSAKSPAPSHAKGGAGGSGSKASASKAADAMDKLKVSSQEQDDQLLSELRKVQGGKEHVNIVFIGHVDAGKSTLGGQILFLTGGVDDRTIQKYEREAKDKNRESWYMAYIMDTNDEERAKGKTVEVGRAHFQTEKKRYTILDAPGHKNYVPNMIGGTSQADIGVLVIAARKGEFETGFERGGQTREHTQLAKTLGVSKLIVVVNKMDDSSILEASGQWSKGRFDEIQNGLTPFLKQCGYNVKRDIQFVPISGLTGANVRDRVAQDVCPWWSEGSLFEVLDALDAIDRAADKPFRLPIIDKFKDMGTVVMGKVEAGICKVGSELMVMPNRTPVKVVSLCMDDEEDIQICGPGENIRLKLSGIEEEEVSLGFVLCSAVSPCPVVTRFEAQIAILELLEHKAIFTAGYKAVVHLHSIIEECEIVQLLFEIDPRSKEKKRVKFVKSGKLVVARVQVERPIPVEKFGDVPQLGRFTLRDEGKTIAIGKIVRLPAVKDAGD